jgi:hypothetical protein
MSLKIPTASRVNFTALDIAAWNAGTPLYMHLFAANHAPVDGDVLATYTAIEASGTGYAAQLLSTWADFGLDGSNRRIIKPAPSVYTWTAGYPTIYGYYVSDFSTNLWWAELFTAGPIVVSAGVPTLFVAGQFSFTSEF